ncbi:MarR family transcriptional regulator [Streptomyces sp. NBC_01795]|uniref:MarR family winged helix-turn-helix transcriptional regulator n=1 Tax=Streptomyces sp. NBC_01795 TaxID=2975943 RepID=UPI002DD8D7D0|nr:MarR family transcriptional regulator [Streptomyces sp. NBC_01795]WSA95540.1 MarR family transcriptional regulator [Streptomyces sp. NBC_01795]
MTETTRAADRAGAAETAGTARAAGRGSRAARRKAVPAPEIATSLVRLSHLVDHVFADVCRDFDLTQQQAQLLCMLIDGPVGMTELSRLLHVEKSSLTGLVDRVERRGLVERVRADNDRRAFRIALTTTGAELADDSHAAMCARLEALGQELGQRERETLNSGISCVLAAHTAETGRPWDRTE